MATYQVGYHDEVFDDLDEIPKNIQKRIKRAIEKRLATSPDKYGERLARDLAGLWKIRVGGYRILLDILEDGHTLYDPGRVLEQRLAALRKRIKEVGCRKIPLPDGSYIWDLKPDWRPGEIFEL